MKKILAVFLLSFAVLAHAATTEPTKLDFRSVNVGQIVQLIYFEVLHGSYVIDPEILNDVRLVSFRYDSSQGDIRSFISAFFSSIGLTVSRKNDVDYISRKIAPEVIEPDAEIFVYRSRFRDGSYLTDMLAPLFKGSFTARKAVRSAGVGIAPESAGAKKPPVGSAADSIDRRNDTIIFTGSAVEVAMLKKVLAQVDINSGDVMVRGVLYEVQTGKNDGSAFGVALNLLGSKLTVGVGAMNPLENFARFANNSIDVVASFLATDSRFKVVSTPSLRVSSGGTGRFTVGQDVPVIGAITYPGNGASPVQSVEYRSSGVIFDLQPVIHEGAVDLAVMQQVSNFVNTTNGVNNSPTLIKRELKTQLSVADGEVIVIGGLAENKDAGSHSGLSFLPSFMHTQKSDVSSTEILLFLQMTKI